MSKSAGSAAQHGGAGGGDPPCLSGARSSSADIVVLSTNSITITSMSSNASTIRGEIACGAAAAALCRRSHDDRKQLGGRPRMRTT